MRTSERGSGRTAVCYGLLVAAVVGCGPGLYTAPGVSWPGEVSVGYGTRSREMVTSAIASYLPTEADRGYFSVEQMLDGRVAGVVVGRAQDGSPALRIRGRVGGLGGAEPLVVIDGVPFLHRGLRGGLGAVLPHDIARIDVLKDAGSAAIYGARGGNGVIIITTRRAWSP